PAAPGGRSAGRSVRCSGKWGIGAPFAGQRLPGGPPQARRITRDPKLSGFGPALAREIGGQLARIHAIHPPNDTLAFLPLPEPDAVGAAVMEMRRALDKASEPRPALEYILSWLLAHKPAPRPVALVHGDVRTG